MPKTIGPRIFIRVPSPDTLLLPVPEVTSEGPSLSRIKPQILQQLAHRVPVFRSSLQHPSHKPQEHLFVLPIQIFFRILQTSILWYLNFGFLLV